MARRVFCALLLSLPLLSLGRAAAPPSPLTLWYDQPGREPLYEGLPIGNGRIGALILGDPLKERIILNEDSLWTGTDNPSGAYAIDPQKFGSYQLLGQLSITLNTTAAAAPADYRRDLDLATATSHAAYRLNGTAYTREAFASHPAGVMVFRFAANRDGAYSGTLAYSDGHEAEVAVTDHRITCSAALANGLRHETQILVQAENGTVEATDGQITFHGCDSLTVIVGTGTDYAMDPDHHFRGDAPHERVTRQVDDAAKLSYDDLKKAHIDDYQSLFNRVSYDFGRSSAAQKALPFNRRKVEAAKAVDPELEALFLQYGRYLLISCSRPGSLPANLQGLWNESNKPDWFSDYHTDINIQMNYWPAEVTNLSECAQPFYDLTQSQLPFWRKVSAADPAIALPGKPLRGFAIRYSHNIFGGLGWEWNLPGAAWYAQHYWERYAYTGDRKWLADVGYPFMKEVCQFWEDHLKTLPDGRLVVPHAWSPEHGPTEDGVSYAQEIMWDLFTNSAAAADIVGDADYGAKLAALRDKLVEPRIGSWGQLLEWMEEKKGKVPGSPELDTPQDHHRHTSHLFGVFPGHQFSPAKAPELAQAAKVSLAARGDSDDAREWSFAWRAGLWARLLEGDKAHAQFQQMFSNRNTCLNLFGLCPPMQIDGDFGFAATVPEMLLQSHDGDLQNQVGDLLLLPALPSAWPNGSFTGLCARGGFVVDLSWKDGKLADGTVHSTWGTFCKIHYGDKTATLHLLPGKSMPLPTDLF